MTHNEVVPRKPGKSRIVRYANAYYAINEQTLNNAFDNKTSAENKTAKNNSNTTIPPRTPLRRLMAILPDDIKFELKRILRVELYLRRGNVGGRSDKLFALLVLRGILKEYTLKPIRRFLGFAEQDTGLLEEKISGTDYSVIHAVTKGADPEVVRTIGHYNLVSFDGSFYGLPHGLAVDWLLGGITSLTGVFFGRTAREVTDNIKSLTGKPLQQPELKEEPFDKAKDLAENPQNIPQLLGTLESYDVFSYEGWFYGIPHSAGALNLAEIDVMDMPGVIRDVSRDVVESEILEQARMNVDS
jgi:hypothetical protein